MFLGERWPTAGKLGLLTVLVLAACAMWMVGCSSSQTNSQASSNNTVQSSASVSQASSSSKDASDSKRADSASSEESPYLNTWNVSYLFWDDDSGERKEVECNGVFSTSNDGLKADIKTADGASISFEGKTQIVDEKMAVFNITKESGVESLGLEPGYQMCIISDQLVVSMWHDASEVETMRGVLGIGIDK